MKILHIVAGAPTGGAETFSFDAMKALHDKGVEQYVICRPYKHLTDAFDARGIRYKTISFNKWTKAFQQPKIKSAIAEFEPDLIHSWMSRASSFVPAQDNIPVLGWFGGYYDLKNYKSADFYMGVTRDIVRHIGEKSGTPERAYVGHTFGTLEDDAPITRESLGVPEGAKTVLLLSRMHWKKGVDTLLQAAKCIDDVYFLLAGNGPDLEKYKSLAAELGVADRAKFLGWRTDRKALLGVADVCTLPSRYEPFGTVIAESWFAGVPLVATKADGAKQYVEHEVNGLLCEIDDVERLTENLKTALYDDKVRTELIAGGSKTYNELFSREVVTQGLIDAYEDMLSIYHQKQAA